ncbi:MAG: hypothetical protein QOJ64_922 [Acidobacteriota bacterium]|nr:hypothetical protein [Acidobacteriota bacterium]
MKILVDGGPCAKPIDYELQLQVIFHSDSGMVPLLTARGRITGSLNFEPDVVPFADQQREQEGQIDHGLPHGWIYFQGLDWSCFSFSTAFVF